MSSGADAELSFVTAERCVACETHNPPPRPVCSLASARLPQRKAMRSCLCHLALAARLLRRSDPRTDDRRLRHTRGGYLPTECIFFLHGSTSTCCTWTRTCVLAVRTSACMTHIWILAQS